MSKKTGLDSCTVKSNKQWRQLWTVILLLPTLNLTSVHCWKIPIQSFVYNLLYSYVLCIINSCSNSVEITYLYTGEVKQLGSIPPLLTNLDSWTGNVTPLSLSGFLPPHSRLMGYWCSLYLHPLNPVYSYASKSKPIADLTLLIFWLVHPFS